MAVTVSGQWLRNRANITKIPIGPASQPEYFVIHGKYFNGLCCYDYGNMESIVHDEGAGTMRALYLIQSNITSVYGGWRPSASPEPDHSPASRYSISERVLRSCSLSYCPDLLLNQRSHS